MYKLVQIVSMLSLLLLIMCAVGCECLTFTKPSTTTSYEQQLRDILEDLNDEELQYLLDSLDHNKTNHF